MNPRTMTAERLAEIRKFSLHGGDWPGGSLAALQLVLAELDAEVAAHQETKQLLADDDGISSSLEMQLIESRKVAKALAEALNPTHFALKQAIQRWERESFGGNAPESWLDAEVKCRAALALYAAQKGSE